MNKLVKARRLVRAQHTKLVNEIQTLLGASPLDKDAVAVKFQLLTKIGSSLEGYDANITEKMVEENVTDAEQDAEYEAAFSYQEANAQLQSTSTTGGPTDSKKSGKQKKVQKTEEIPTAAGLVATTQRNGCVFSDKNHDRDRCVTALYMDL
ncbi:unnamed protein product [Orchesella dallaii]|uniref:Uncharacterized protein n=1 Tax=Orchesella dallaii TaxID=48710 RepID=A0ABP1QSI5_9HEXA